MADLNYPLHFLHDIDQMSPEDRGARCDELIAWAKRFADGDANAKWVRFHMFELASLAERMRRPSGIT